MEHLLNVYANKAAKGSIADFVGYIEVAEEQATTKLTPGVWLVSMDCILCHKHTRCPELVVYTESCLKACKQVRGCHALHALSANQGDHGMCTLTGQAR